MELDSAFDLSDSFQSNQATPTFDVVELLSFREVEPSTCISTNSDHPIQTDAAQAQESANAPDTPFERPRRPADRISRDGDMIYEIWRYPDGSMELRTTNTNPGPDQAQVTLYRRDAGSQEFSESFHLYPDGTVSHHIAGPNPVAITYFTNGTIVNSNGNSTVARTDQERRLAQNRSSAIRRVVLR